MAKRIEAKKGSLLRSVEERAMEKRVEEEKRKQESDLMRDLPSECVSCILIKLPIDALQRSRFVCKPWYNTINEAKFIKDHLRRSETVFLFASPNKKPGRNHEMVSIFPENLRSFSVEAKLHELSSSVTVEKPFVRRSSKLFIKFLEPEGESLGVREFEISCLGNIRASCDGLVLLDNLVKKGGLVVMNPVTRKLMPLPLGTLSPCHAESYGLALSRGEYKVVHLFNDCLGYVCCEVMNIGGRSWKEIDGPSFGLISWFGHNPVSATGALHWTPHIDHSDYVVSMEVDGEKFHRIPLPKTSRAHDRIIELDGLLSFVAHESFDQIDVWVLKSLLEGVWVKHHSVTRGCILDMVAFCGLRIGGDIVFKRAEDGSFYIYSLQLQKMTRLKMGNERLGPSVALFPHVNSLVSW